MVVWGPQQIVQQPLPTTYTAQFPLPAGAIPPYQLTISNGNPDGTKKVQQACVKLNGVNVLSPTCYHSINPSPQVRTVSLQADNTIAVNLGGGPTTFVTITITANQATLAASPSNGTQGQTLSVTLTGQSTNWVAGQTNISFGGEINVDSFNVTGPTSADAQITISSTAALGPRTITTTTGAAVVSGVDAFTINALTPPGPSSSTVTTLAGSAGNPGLVDGVGSAARFRNLAGIAAGPNNIVYVADAGNHSIRQVSSSGEVTTVAGIGYPDFFDDQGTAAGFNNPQGVAVDGAGNVYVADTGNHAVRRIDAAGNVTTVAGDGTAGFVNGAGVNARFNSPRGVAVDAVGRIYVADTGNHAVRRIDAAGNVATVAGDGAAGSTNSPNARFNGLAGIAADGNQIYIYVADANNHSIRRLDQSDTVITLAGLDRGFKDGTAAESRFADPVGVAVDGAGHVIVTETTNSLIREIDPARAINGDPNAVSTLAGTGERGSTDGSGAVAKFNRPSGVTVTSSGAVIVADTGNQTLRKITLGPVIASLDPAQGGAGTAVTINGNRFDGSGPSSNIVLFAASGGGTVTAAVSSATSAQLNVTVPAGAVTGGVTVQTANGTSNAATFTVTGGAQPPVIADFNPKSGPIGTLVTLTGSNLRVGAANPVVTFAGSGGRLQALVTFSSATEVRATVPNGAGAGVIDLTTSAGVATTSQPFTVQGSQDFAVTLAPSSTAVGQGSTATYVVSVTNAPTTFTQLVSLTATGLPAGAMATFNPSQITAGATSTLSVKLSPTLSPTSYSFTVQGKAQIDGSDATRTASASFTVMAAGATTLAGRVLSTEDVPIPNCTVSAPAPSGSDVTAITDGAGNFLLSGLQEGPSRPIFIQPPSGSVYPAIKEPADVVANQANVVPYTFYLPAIDPLDTPINPTGPTNVTNARVPGLMMTIPQGVRLRVLGSSADVTHVSITPVPVDRTPAPLPSAVMTTMVYTSQPGNSCVLNASNQCITDNSGPKVPVTYPNLSGVSPGTQVPLWAFDHNTVQWYQYGTGTVSADGKTIAPNAGVGLRDFSWHFPSTSPDGNPGDSDEDPADSCPTSPPNRSDCLVDYSTGMKIEKKTDITFGGARGGLSLTRVFTTDNANTGTIYRFGLGWKDNYDIRLTGPFNSNGVGRVVWPEQRDGRLFSYDTALSSGGVATFTTRATTAQLGDTVRRIDANTIEYRAKRGVIMRFEPHQNGQYYRLKQIINRNGDARTLTYSGSNLTQITDAVGRSITFQYGAPNCAECVWKAIDPMNRVTTYGYDAFKRLTQVTDAHGKTMSYGYVNFTGFLASVTDRRGNAVKQISYDSNSRVISQTFADGGIERYVYTLSGTMVTGVTITDPLGRSMTKRFNAAGYVIEEIDEMGQQMKIERDINTNLAVKTTGPCGCPEVERAFDARGNITSIKDRLGRIIKLQHLTVPNISDYDPLLDQQTQYTDARGNVTNFGYDAAAPNTLTPRGNLRTVTDARLKTTTYDYDYTRGGVMIKMTDPLNNKWELDYDANGFIRSDMVKRNSDQAVIYQTLYEFDLVGNLKKITDGEGRVGTMNYDDLNRIISSTDPANATTTYSYDENGNRTGVTDALSRQWMAGYDKKDRWESNIDPLGRVTRWQYDAADQLIKVTSPSGRVTRYTYDERGQRKTITDGLGNDVTFSYDNRRKLKTLTDQRGNAMTFDYDELSRLISQRDPLGRLMTFEYDEMGNIKAKVDRLGRRIDILYDALNRPQQVAYADATVTYGYDDAGRRTSVSDAAGAITWTYDEANRTKTETTSLGVVQYDYNKANQRKTMIAADRAPVTYGYDAAGRLGTITQGGETFTNGYDILSRQQSLQRPNGVTTSYEYDIVDRLMRLSHTNSSGIVLEDLQYEFNRDDEVSKITSLAFAPLVPLGKTVSVADAANRIGQFGGASFGFNTEGQTISKADTLGTSSYQWDARGRLTQVTPPNGQTVSYNYDAFDRRISRVANGITTTFQYDGLDLVVDRVSGGAAIDYLHGQEIDNNLRQTGGSFGALYYLHDHLRSTIGLTDNNGSLIERQRYEAFGVSTVSLMTRYGYSGRETEDQSGLMYYRTRWYSPDQGRFISEDAIFTQNNINLYSYVNNSPLKYVDPLGLQGGPIDLGSGWTGRVDVIPNHPQGFELHVWDPAGRERGIVSGRDGWIGKHGKPAQPPSNIPQTTLNRINGLNCEELRRRGHIPQKGFGDIRNGRYLNPGRRLYSGLPRLLGGLQLLSGLLDDYERYERARRCGRTYEEQLRHELNDAGPYIMTPYGAVPNPYWRSQL